MRRAAMVLFLLLMLTAGCAKPSAAPVAKGPASQPVTPASQPAAPDTQSGPKPGPSPGAAAYSAALTLISQEKYFQAVPQLEEAVKLDPELADAWNDLSYASLKSETQNLHIGTPNHPRTYQQAIDAAQRALSLKPDWAFALYNLGLAQLASFQYDAAIAPLQRSAALQPDRPEPLTALGLALAGAGRPAEARAACSRAEGMDIPFAPARTCLNLLRDGYKRLPESEATVGPHRILPAGGAQPESWPPGKSEWIRVSPNWTCAVQYPDGYRVALLDCGDPVVYGYGITTRETGATPAGIGVGSPWADVTRAYGETFQGDGAYHYAVGNLELNIQGSEREGVTYMGFFLPEPVLAIDRLVHSQNAPEPVSYEDLRLLGIYLEEPIAEVETPFGKPERTTPGPEGEVRTYRGGSLAVTVRDNKVAGVMVNQRVWTYRGIGIGDQESKVRRLYGKPDQEGPTGITYRSEYMPGPPSARFLTFDLQNGRVSGIRITGK